jgi:hypothetical protein
MKREYSRVYQFKVTLNGIQPPVWRRIQVPETDTFWELHVAIQDSMGWLDDHVHEFTITDPSTDLKERVGIADEDSFLGKEVHAGWNTEIADYFSPENPKAEYVYDFGDNWQHTVKLEKVLPCEESVRYPICIGGKRACPPEDCGGVWGYQDLLEIISNPSHEEYEETLDWLGGEFDPERFEPADVVFADPQKRLKAAFRGV